MRTQIILDFVNGNWEHQYDSEEATQRIRNAIYRGSVLYSDFLDSSVTTSDLRKVTSTVLRRQPSYVDMFQFANNNLDGLVALANADIVFRGLGFLDEHALEWRDKSQPLALALSVSKPTGKFGQLCEDMNVDIKGHCDFWGRNYGVSWDAIVFKSPLQTPSNGPLNYTVLTPPPGGAPAYMNALHAEGCAARFLLDAGYRLHNPCKSIVAEHWHCMGRKMHFSAPGGSSAWLGRCSGGINVWGQAGGLGTLC